MPRGIVGSMSTMGFITEPRIKAAKKIDYWFECRKNQSIVIPEVESYQFIKESCQGKNISIDEFCEKLKNSLTKVLLECFDSVTIEVEPKTPAGVNPSTFTAVFRGTVMQGGVPTDVAKAVIFNNKSYERIEEGRHGTN